MKINRKQFNNSLKNFSKKELSSEQKNIMLSNIYAESPILTSPEAPIKSWPAFSYSVFFKKRIIVTGAVVCVLMLSGFTYASANSLPGDLLYGVKVNILEPIILATKTNDSEKNEYKLSLLNKRISELEELNERGIKNQDNIADNYRVIRKNVLILENSSIVEDEEKIIEVNKKIEIYNNMVDSKLKIETRLNATHKVDTEEKLDDVVKFPTKDGRDYEEDDKDDDYGDNKQSDTDAPEPKNPVDTVIQNINM